MLNLPQEKDERSDDSMALNLLLLGLGVVLLIVAILTRLAK